MEVQERLEMGGAPNIRRRKSASFLLHSVVNVNVSFLIMFHSIYLSSIFH